MNRKTIGLTALVFPALLAAQNPPPAAPKPAAPSPALPAPSYRGFTAGATYREFATRARVLTRAGGRPLVCNTSRRTAQLMECGVMIRDPADSATFYLSAYILESKVAMVSFGDSGGQALVDRMQRDLTRRLGRPQRAGNGTWQWTYGPRIARLNWRGRGPARWIYVALWDQRVMDGISKYVGRKTVGRKP